MNGARRARWRATAGSADSARRKDDGWQDGTTTTWISPRAKTSSSSPEMRRKSCDSLTASFAPLRSLRVEIFKPSTSHVGKSAVRKHLWPLVIRRVKRVSRKERKDAKEQGACGALFTALLPWMVIEVLNEEIRKAGKEWYILLDSDFPVKLETHLHNRSSGLTTPSPLAPIATCR